MKLTTTMAVVVCFTVASVACAKAGDKQEGKSVLRDTLCGVDGLYGVKLSDGSALRIYAQVESLKKRQQAGVGVSLYPNGGHGKMPSTWSAHLTTVDYVPGTESYYALVKVMEDRIFIFCIWNGQYVTIDKKDGRILKNGKGDDVLKKYDSLVPLKLPISISGPSTGRYWSDAEWEKAKKEVLEAGRHASAINLTQSIPGSKLEKDYVIQFDKAGLDRRPLVVIAWKARADIGVLVDLNHLDKAVPVITIQGHLVTPPVTKKAIYALQPDYSLQQLSLTDEEITRLFSHITRSQERTTFDDRNTLPSDPYWEQKVDPHLKVVEPPQKDAG